ncbi:hypothetical protein GCM10007941_13830 [Amphritea balenae]|nr:hypothetical protein GCM10007941_13830 [Amphritea balenae]
MQNEKTAIIEKDEAAPAKLSDPSEPGIINLCFIKLWLTYRHNKPMDIAKVALLKVVCDTVLSKATTLINPSTKNGHKGKRMWTTIQAQEEGVLLLTTGCLHTIVVFGILLEKTL